MPSPAEALALTATEGGTLILLRVSPGASRDALRGVHGDRLKLSVRAPPERGRANRTVVALLEGVLAAGRGRIEIRAGAASQDKTAFIAGTSPDAVRAGIDHALAATGRERKRR